MRPLAAILLPTAAAFGAGDVAGRPGTVDPPGAWTPFLGNTGDKLKSSRYQLGAFEYIVARRSR